MAPLRNPSIPSIRKARVTPLTETPEQLLLEKDQAFSPQGPERLFPEKDQGFSPVKDLNDFSQERPELLCLIRDLSDSFQRKNQGISPQTESWVTSPRERSGRPPQRETHVVSTRERPGCLPSERELSDFSQRNTRASLLIGRPGQFLPEKN